MSELCIDSELKRLLGINAMTTEEILSPQPTDFDPTEVRTIKAQVGERCIAWKLSSEQRLKCESAALDYWWRLGRSVAYCVSKGWKKAEEFKVPDVQFCCQRLKCAGLPRCPRDPVCND